MKNIIDFSLIDENGEVFQLSNNLPIIIYFYPKDDTSGCTLEAIDFSYYKNEFNKLGYEIVGISKDSQKSHCNFIKKHNLTIKLLVDDKQKIASAFDVIKEKQMYGKKYLGIERSTFIIDKNLNIIKSWRNVKAKNHAIEVLDYLQNNLDTKEKS